MTTRHRFGGAVLLAAMLLTSVGCVGYDWTGRKWQPWEHAYRERGERVVVERFEVDLRNTEAFGRVVDYYQPTRVLFVDGTASAVHHDLEVLAVRPGLERAMRRTTAQGTIRRTTQMKFQFNSRSGTRHIIPVPEETKTPRSMLIPAFEDGPASQRIATGDCLCLARHGRFEEGWELEIELLAKLGEQPGPADEPVALHSFHLFLRPGESVVLRTYPNKPESVPGFLRFEHEGQQYDTVYLITYVNR